MKNPASIHSLTRNLVHLQTPPNVPKGEIWRYGYGFPIQISPTHGAVVANIHRKQARTEDYEVGADIIVFDDFNRILPEKGVRLAQIHQEINPHTKGMSDMVKQCPVGGFVPLGAKTADGKPHPHAGTGFGLVMNISYAPDDGDINKPYEGCYRGDKSYVYYELQQYAFDGENFTIARSDRVEIDQLVSGQLYLNSPMRWAIPDGDDLIAAAVIGLPGSSMETIMGEENFGTGMARWRRGKDGWRIVEFHPVAMDFLNFEPSLVRDTDGSLLFSVRPGYQSDSRRDILVWRSRDGGKTWKKVIKAKNVRFQSPVTLNTAADGTPYIIGNNIISAMMEYEEGFMDGMARTTCREILCIWELNAQRNGLRSPLIAAFPRYEFGRPPLCEAPPPEGKITDPGYARGRDWTCDHPNGMNIRLQDGRWHHVLVYRLLAQAEVQGGILPTPHSGFRIEEVFSTGPAKPEWIF